MKRTEKVAGRTVTELYAKDCYNMTEQHLSTVNSLTDLNRVYTTTTRWGILLG